MLVDKGLSEKLLAHLLIGLRRLLHCLFIGFYPAGVDGDGLQTHEVEDPGMRFLLFRTLEGLLG